MDLFVHEGERLSSFQSNISSIISPIIINSAEDAVIAFCKKNVADDVTTCIRQLVPVVLERIEAKPVEV